MGYEGPPVLRKKKVNYNPARNYEYRYIRRTGN